jgi:hypothetical protein
MRGKSGRCPACGATIAVPPAPAAAPAGEFDLLSVDPLTMGLGQPAAAAAADPLAGPRGGAADPLAQPAPAAAAPATSSSNKWLIAGIAGGGGLLVVVVLVVVAMSSMGGSDPVAQAPSGPTSSGPTTPVTPSATPSSSPSATSTGSTTSSTTATTPSTGSNGNQAASASAAQPADDPTKADSTASAGSSSPPAASKSPALIPGEHSVVELPAALQTWQNQPGAKLSGIFNPADTENPVAHLSWMAGLLPHLEYQKEYDKLLRDKSIDEKANKEVATVIIKEFQNPLDGRQRFVGYPLHNLALTHFVGMSGVEDARNVCAAQLPRSDPRAGVFGYAEIARPADITDGTSQTVMVVGSGELASPWLLGGGATIRGAREPIFDRASGLGTKGLPAPGTLAVMADGSVRYIPTSVDPQVFRALCTIHGAESIDLEAAAPALPIETLK